jgi:hypothetical protein
VFSARYVSVLKSDRWKRLKSRLLQKRGCRCESCGDVGVFIDLHHKHYETLGRERHSDVLLLCRDCHRRHDHIRREQKRIDRASDLFGMTPSEYMEAFHDR